MSNSSFTLQEKINESSTTSVYKAFQIALDRVVLLKILHKHLNNDAELVMRFTREARACALLRSENIVQVYDLTTIEETPAIVMEFVEGKSLKEIIGVGEKQPYEFVRTVARDVLNGLTVAHEHGVVHRDIKPGNIVVANNGVVKVTDFGLATIALSPTVTMEGMLLGTPAYMSPEQIRGDTLDGRTDLFSLGATLVELLIGERIFHGETYSECIKKIMQFEPAFLGAFAEYIPQEFEPFLIQLLEPEREKRFSSARHALQCIESGSTSNSIVSSPVKINAVEQPSETQQPHKKKKNYSFIILGFIVVLSAGLFFVTQQTALFRVLPSEVSRDSSLVSDTQQKNETTAVQQTQPTSFSSIQTKTAIAIPQLAEQKNNGEQFQPADSGFVSITCTPWAKVFVNSQYIGETPLSAIQKLQSGTYTIAFHNPMFVPIMKTITVRPNAQTSVDADFLESAGYIVLNVLPWAEVSIDDQYRDTTPLHKPLIASSGKRLLRFHNPAYDDIVKEVMVQSGDTVSVTINYLHSAKK